MTSARVHAPLRLAAATLGVVVGLAPLPTRAAPGVDAMVLNATLANVEPPVFLAVQDTSAFSVAGSCSPTFPSYISTDDGLPSACPNLTGSGTYMNLICGTGLLTGTLTVTEPSGETATLSYTIVIVAGIGAVEAGFSDDGGSGVAAGAAVITPEPPSSCLTGVQQFQLQAAVVGAHV